MHEPELDEYFRFTGPARLSKAMHTLEGLLLGLVIDHEINDRELAALTQWIVANEEFADRHPFNELIPLLANAIKDRTIDEEERADLLWCCGKFQSADGYYEGATADMQRLQGILAGVMADGEITDEEARKLYAWVTDRAELQTVWPYAEIESVLTQVLADGRIDSEEHAALMEYFQHFSGTEGRPGPGTAETTTLPKTIAGICAVAPEIEFPKRVFCFTGQSERWTRNEFSSLVELAQGIHHPRVTQSLNYLVVGGGGNPCWAYSCYGRKVEAAVRLRQKGLPLMIVHEYDIWDSFADAGIV